MAKFSDIEDFHPPYWFSLWFTHTKKNWYFLAYFVIDMFGFQTF